MRTMVCFNSKFDVLLDAEGMREVPTGTVQESEALPRLVLANCITVTELNAHSHAALLVAVDQGMKALRDFARAQLEPVGLAADKWVL